MSPLLLWLLLTCAYVGLVRFGFWLGRPPTVEPSYLDHFVSCPVEDCGQLLAPGEHCRDHLVFAPLRLGQVQRDGAAR